MSDNPKTKVVLLWVDEDQVSVEDLRIINEEHRFQSAVTSVKIGSKYHKAVVRLISNDQRKLDDMEELICEEIDAAVEARKMSGDRKGRSARHKRGPPLGAASINQVASAVGERLQPSTSQADKVKELARSKKSTAQAQRSAQDDVDRVPLLNLESPTRGPFDKDLVASNIKSPGRDNSRRDKQANTSKSNTVRELFSVKRNQPTKKSPVRALFNVKRHEPTKKSPVRALFNEKQNEPSKKSPVQSLFSIDEVSDDEVVVSEGEVDGVYDDNDDNDEPLDDLNKDTCCSHCRELQKSFTASPSLFLKTLTRLCIKRSISNVSYLEAHPLYEGVAKCELSKGSNVFISVADKNSLKRDGDGDPAKMVRIGLIALYGRDALEVEDLTAKGTRNGSKGMRPHVRRALLAFVNRNRRLSFKEMTETEFNKVVNKKKSQMQRHKSKSPSERSAKAGKQVTKKKTQGSPWKVQAHTNEGSSRSDDSQLREARYVSPFKSSCGRDTVQVAAQGDFTSPLQGSSRSDDSQLREARHVSPFKSSCRRDTVQVAAQGNFTSPLQGSSRSDNSQIREARYVSPFKSYSHYQQPEQPGYHQQAYRSHYSQSQLDFSGPQYGHFQDHSHPQQGSNFNTAPSSGSQGAEWYEGNMVNAVLTHLN